MMVYIIWRFCDSSLSQSEVKVGKILQPPPFIPIQRRVPKIPLRIEILQLVNLISLKDSLWKKAAFLPSKKVKLHESFQWLVNMEYLLT